MIKSCVKCGSSCELLLNLVCCTSPRCQNFDKKFYKKWLSGNGRTYKVPSKDWIFLGRFFCNKPVRGKSLTRLYDLYHNGPEVYAINSDDSSRIYSGDAAGAPIGFYQHWWAGPADVDINAREALLEAAARKDI